MPVWSQGALLAARPGLLILKEHFIFVFTAVGERSHLRLILDDSNTYGQKKKQMLSQIRNPPLYPHNNLNPSDRTNAAVTARPPPGDRLPRDHDSISALRWRTTAPRRRDRQRTRRWRSSSRCRSRGGQRAWRRGGWQRRTMLFARSASGFDGASVMWNLPMETTLQKAPNMPRCHFPPTIFWRLVRMREQATGQT